MKRITDTNADGLDLNLLLVFEAISKDKNITRAAARLGLSQPAVSGALARLRDTIGDPLFVRGGQGVQPTPRAQQMLEPVEAALRLIRNSLQRGADFVPATSDSTFTLLLTDFGEALYLPHLLDRLSRPAPNVSLRVRQLQHRNYAHLLEMGEADIAIGALRKPRDMMHYRKLYSSDFVCVVRADHPRFRSTISKKDYLAGHHLVESHNNLARGLLAKALPAGAALKIAARIPHPLVIPQIIARTDLIATVPRPLADIFDNGSIKLIPLPFKIPSHDVGLYWHPRNHCDPANRWMRSLLIELFGKPGPRPTDKESRTAKDGCA